MCFFPEPVDEPDLHASLFSDFPSGCFLFRFLIFHMSLRESPVAVILPDDQGVDISVLDLADN